MIKDVKPRGKGKTWDMLKLQRSTGYPIVVSNKGQANAVDCAAKEMPDYDPPEVITYEEYKRLNEKPHAIIIDNAKYLLKIMFSESEIYAISMSETLMYTKEDIATMIGKAPSEFEIVDSDDL